MLSFFRRRMKLILWILVVVVIVTFIPWGVGVRMRFRGEKRLSAAGELFGKTVSRPDFDDACMAIRTDSLLRRVQMNDAEISQRAWERLLMLTQARREGISVSDRELARAIRAQFGGEGSFDQRVYENILRNMGLTPDVYEGWTRESLMITLRCADGWMRDVGRTAGRAAVVLRNRYQLRRAFQTLSRRRFLLPLRRTGVSVQDSCV